MPHGIHYIGGRYLFGRYIGNIVQSSSNTLFSCCKKMPKCFFWTRETGAQISQGSQHPPTDTLNSCITDSITWAEIGLCPSLMCRCAQSGKRDKISRISRTILVNAS